MNSGSAAFFLFQGCSSGNRCVNGNILISIHLLKICTKTHDQQTNQRYMIFFTEIHQSLSRFCFQMENIQRGVHRIGYIQCSTKIRIAAAFPFCFQTAGTFQGIINRLRTFCQLAEVLFISYFCLRTCLIGKILLQLFNIGSHFLRKSNFFIEGAAVDFYDIFHKTD